MNWYKKAIEQELFRGDSAPINIENYDNEYAIRELGKDLGSAMSWGPGIYFTGQEDIAGMYGSNITKKILSNANILTKQSPIFNYRQIDKMLQGVDKQKVETAISNWSEDYKKGKNLLIQSILNADNPLEQLMNIWADIFYHQNPQDFVDLMIRNGIDGISIQKAEDETYYVIYNKNVLK